MAEEQKVEEARVEMLSPEGAARREETARVLVRNYSLASAAVGLIPLPFVDLALALAVQVRMLQKLSQHYGYTFESKQRIYAVVGSLFSGAALPLLIMPAIFSAVKLIPILGTVPSLLAMPVILGSCTFALGRTFQLHFEGGGTLLSFKPEAMRQTLRAYYRQGMSEGKAPAAGEEAAPQPASAG